MLCVQGDDAAMEQFRICPFVTARHRPRLCGGGTVVLCIAALVAYKLLLRRRTKQPRNTFTDGGIVLSPWSAEHNYAPPAQEDALGGGLNL